MEKAYPALPENGYQIKYVPESLEASMSPAFYLTPPMDMPQNNVIYINRGSGSYDVLTVLAHEGYPGHLYQNVYYLGREVPEVRHALNFTAYSEGWATYVENRSYLFEDNGLGNVMGELMRRDSSVTKAVYALLDTESTMKAGTGKKRLLFCSRFIIWTRIRSMKSTMP